MKNTQCTLIIATYNWPQALALCLKSVLGQTVLPGEIIIADDGSTPETKAVIDDYKELTNVPIKHLWHKDDGYRKTIILNEAIRVASFPYIIQTDGDMIIHKLFIQEHLEAARKGLYIRGSRAMINKSATEKLLQNNSIDVSFFSKGLINRMNSLHSSIVSAFYDAITRSGPKKGVLGCNFSYWKKDVVAVNGYNNGIIGWGHEDTELGARLINNGVSKKNLKYKAVCFHLFHAHFPRESEALHWQLVTKAFAEKIVECANGYSNAHPVDCW